MATTKEQRPRYFQGQYLGPEDLEAAVAYARSRDARHALGAHTWGIAAGLQLHEVEVPGGGVEVSVRPGYAWDGFGRTVVLLAPLPLPPALFRSYTFDPAVDAGNPAGRLIEVWLRYDEAGSRAPRPGFEACDTEDDHSRVTETARLEVGERPAHPDRHGPVVVADRSVDAADAYRAFVAADGLLADESVPFQGLPGDGEPARWLVPLGLVRWRPADPPANQPGRFVTSSAADLAAGQARRVYAGVVAGTVYAADGAVRLADRTRDFRTTPAQDLARVEGSLRVEGDVRLFGRHADFRQADGTDAGVPLRLRRHDAAAPARTTLQAVIGAAAPPSGRNRFAVGPLENAGTPAERVVERFVVLDSGNVGVGTPDPIAPLHLPAGGLQIGADTATAANNFHLASDAAGGPRALRLYNGNFGAGAHLFTFASSGNLGVGTANPVTALHLPDRGLQLGAGAAADNFHLAADGNGGARGFRLYGGNFGAGTHLMTVLPNGNVGIGLAAMNPQLALDVQGDFGRANGPATVSLFGSRVGDVGNGTLFLRSGGGTVAFDGGDNVGVNTAAPQDRLDVAGDVRLLSNANPLRFTSSWSAFPDAAPDRAEICNDTGAFKSLMIVGNRSAGVGRRVGVWDRLDVHGSAFKPGGGSWATLSDARLKANVRPLGGGTLDKLLKLRGVHFEWKEPQRMGGLAGPQVGLVAQDVEPVFPEWVRAGPDGYKELEVRGFEALAIEALRELREENQALRARVQALEGKPARPAGERPAAKGRGRDAESGGGPP